MERTGLQHIGCIWYDHFKESGNFAYVFFYLFYRISFLSSQEIPEFKDSCKGNKTLPFSRHNIQMFYDFVRSSPEFSARYRFYLLCKPVYDNIRVKNILFSLIYSLTLLCMVARSFLINSVDVISEGITSRYLPSNSFEIFFCCCLRCG